MAPSGRSAQNELRRRIENGTYPVGTYLPSESALGKEFGLSRNPVRGALQALARSGLLYTQMGKGSIVRDNRPIVRDEGRRLDPAVRGRGRPPYFLDIEDAGMNPGTTVDVRPCPVTPLSAQLLQVPADSELIERRQLITADGQIVMISGSYVDRRLARGTILEQPDIGTDGIYAVLETLPGVGNHLHYRVRTHARLARPDEAVLFSLPADAPVLDLTRVAYNEAGKPIEVNYVTFDTRWTLERQIA
jgi:GntR family transcriptional regulator